MRGRRLNFEEICGSRPGDDVLTMDWKATARLRKPQVRIPDDDVDFFRPKSNTDSVVEILKGIVDRNRALRAQANGPASAEQRNMPSNGSLVSQPTIIWCASSVTLKGWMSRAGAGQSGSLRTTMSSWQLAPTRCGATCPTPEPPRVAGHRHAV